MEETPDPIGRGLWRIRLLQKGQLAGDALPPLHRFHPDQRCPRRGLPRHGGELGTTDLEEWLTLTG